MMYSDHAPVLAVLNSTRPRTNRPFHFENGGCLIRITTMLPMIVVTAHPIVISLRKPDSSLKISGNGVERNPKTMTF
jgi:hypothetical protein